MASSYSSDLKIELMATGENPGTWGDKGGKWVLPSKLPGFGRIGG